MRRTTLLPVAMLPVSPMIFLPDVLLTKRLLDLSRVMLSGVPFDKFRAGFAPKHL
jgi:hypothetical protein